MSSYVPIRVNTLRASASLTFDVYLYVDNHYVHYKRDKDVLETSEIEQMRSKKIKKLHIPPEQEPKYLEYLDRGLESVATSSAPVEEKGRAVNDTVVTMAENAERHFETEEGFKSTGVRFGKVVDFLSSDKGALKSILGASALKQDEHQHAATVATLCLALCQRSGITESKELMDVSLAALVHDIGKAKLDIDITKPYESMTAEEKAQYRRHPQIALDMLSGKPFITPRILGMVASHEELAFGKGYPEGKNLLELPTVYQILSLANAFVTFCSQQGLSHAQGVDPFFAAHEKHFSSDMIMLLSTVLA